MHAYTVILYCCVTGGRLETRNEYDVNQQSKLGKVTIYKRL